MVTTGGDRPKERLMSLKIFLSHSSKYRDLALKMAHVNEVVAPYASWAWALDAKLSPPGNRERALGFALHLDGDSEWIASIPDAEKQAANKWFSANNPFKERDAQPRRES